MVIPVAFALMTSASTVQVWFALPPLPLAMVTFTVKVLLAPTAPLIADAAAVTVTVAAPATELVALPNAVDAVTTAFTPAVREMLKS
jgi:hypothetical protein